MDSPVLSALVLLLFAASLFSGVTNLLAAL